MTSRFREGFIRTAQREGFEDGRPAPAAVLGVCLAALALLAAMLAAPSSPAIAAPAIEVEKTADGSDPDGDFSADEFTTIDSIVTYRVVIDNDSPFPVTVTSLVDDTHPGIVCRDAGGNDVMSRTLAPDDGDGPGLMDGGDDEVACFYEQPAPDVPETVVTSTVTVTVEDDRGNEGVASARVTVRTYPVAVAGPDGPVSTPQVLPSVGGGGSPAGVSRAGLLAVLGAALVAGGLWTVWNHKRQR